MASVCQPERCEYCGMAPCVGDRCPQWWDDDDDETCGMCGDHAAWPTDGLCSACWRFEYGDDDDDGDDWDDPLDFEGER